jgi:hypothetical protein
MLLTGLLRLMFPMVLALVTVNAIAADSGMSDRSSFIFPNSDRRLIREQELLDADQHKLWQARNEIFARKGYRFSNPDAKQFFEGQSYYRPTQDQVPLNQIEAKNVKIIRRFEDYLRDYPEQAFEATYQIKGDLSNTVKVIEVRECPSEDCRVLGLLRLACLVNTDIRMEKPDWVYVRSSICGETSGPSDGYLQKAVLTLVAG